MATRSVLLVEDSEADGAATARVLSRCADPPAVYVVADGDDALTLLRRPPGAAAPDGYVPPSVVLLDLNLPGTSGQDVLARIKADDATKHIPVVILTTSAARADVDYCYRHGASGYLVKPVDLTRFAKVVRDFYSYWFEGVLLPD